MNPVITWLRMTDWHMDPPAPYSLFHISITAVGIVSAVWLSRRLMRRRTRSEETCGVSFDPQADMVQRVCRILFTCGILLAVGELYKQLFLYYVVFGTYNWWYFPFQLCSIPMYLCLLLPMLRRNERLFRVVCTFLQDFGLLGGIMALAEPSGLMHPYWTLTLHGLVWHILLVFIGLVLAYSRIPLRRPADYLKTLPLLALFCLIATGINLATGGAADMFYISPYYPVTQAVFNQISLRLGTAAGICIYLLCLCAGGFLCHLLAPHLSRKMPETA